jgi:hypothetical protein
LPASFQTEMKLMPTLSRCKGKKIISVNIEIQDDFPVFSGVNEFFSFNFDVDADDFFTLATAQRDTKITIANKNSHSPVTFFLALTSSLASFILLAIIVGISFISV